MKIVCAPDKFKECLSASAAASAMAEGIRRVMPESEIDICPVADGGEGTVEALIAGSRGERRTSSVTGPCGAAVDADWGLLEGHSAVIEMAAAAGLALVPHSQRDPRRTTTFGVGELILAAAAAGARRIIVGLGGSATVDGGCGMAQALGIRFVGPDGDTLASPLCGGDLARLTAIETDRAVASLAGVEIVAACDVDSPLLGATGAARVFGPQKGATPAAVAELEAGLTRLARLLRRDLGIDMATLSGAGAAGGLAAGLVAFAGARMASGIDLVLETIGFEDRVRGADLVLTGEGRLDGQSLAGKATVGVARAARADGVPTVALVGAAGDGADAALEAGLTEWRLIGPGLDAAESMGRAAELLAAAAGQVVLERRNA